MKKLIYAGIAAVTLMVSAALTVPANAQTACWSGPLGILHGCNYVGPDYYPYGYPPPPYYPPPRY
jgi:hypothetical protein